MKQFAPIALFFNTPLVSLLDRTRLHPTRGWANRRFSGRAYIGCSCDFACRDLSPILAAKSGQARATTNEEMARVPTSAAIFGPVRRDMPMFSRER